MQILFVCSWPDRYLMAENGRLEYKSFNNGTYSDVVLRDIYC